MSSIPRCLVALLAVSLAACNSDPVSSDDGLPPDPGEAGRATLEGVDADRDGLRDDVQRHIFLEHDDDAVRRALVQVAEPLIRSYTVAGGDEQVLRFTEELNRGVDCVHSRLDTAEAARAVSDLSSVVLNTPERIRASAAADVAVSGNTFVLPDDLSESCDA
ncbi:MAG: hypothetical protein AAFQ53_08435 [Bacteroidota bacterium]